MFQRAITTFFDWWMFLPLTKYHVYYMKLLRSVLLSALLLHSFIAHTTHIRAGEIVVRRVDNLTLTYEFTFIGYRDTDSGILFGNGVFDFGDGNVQDGRENPFEITETRITDNIVRSEWTVRHTYRTQRNYVVSYLEQNRNGGISNMTNSVNTPFYVESLVVIDPFLGLNNSPILTVPPIDEGSPGVLFIHNPGAFDEDGDILTYELVIPRQSAQSEVNGYMQPNDPIYYSNWSTGSEDGGPAEFYLNDNGDLVWNSPGDDFRLGGQNCPDGVSECSEYNVAFRITEWRERNGQLVRVGYITRDMQIIIYEGDNEKPELETPPNLCIVAGDTVRQLVVGTDPDGHAVKLEAFGGPFEVNSAAFFEPSDLRFQGPPGYLDFTWETVCGHVRERPYEVQFKVTDNPVEDGRKVGPSLVNFGTWEITVVGPKPTGLLAEANSGRSITLSWDEYACSNAESIEIYRRVGAFPFESENCEVGIPAESGYRLIGKVDGSQMTYLDTNLAPGADYCYRIVASFPNPGGGTSYASEEACLTLLADAPVMTNVDILVSGTSDGQALVKWTPPYEVDPIQFPPPYTYSLYRGSGYFLNDPVEVVARIEDTLFVDTNINTVQNALSYRVALYDASGNFVDSSAIASSVRLEPVPLLASIELSWQGNVPWSNTITDYPYHYIYRDQVGSNPDELVLIDSVDVTTSGFLYLDEGRFNNESLDDQIEYCYYVTTYGSYQNSPLLPSPLINNSNVICAQPNDNVPPCAPVGLRSARASSCEEFLEGLGCSFSNFSNEIEWDPDLTGVCEDDIHIYRIYFSDTGLEEDYALLDSTIENSYEHTGLNSFKGCYRISAVDRSLNESSRSEALCFDNCPNFSLPNVFTPNGDGYNDYFTPYYFSSDQQAGGIDTENCPRFVLDVQFEVFDRSGKQVYNLADADEPSIFINWDGRTKNGTELPSGTYFYVAKVTFDVLEIGESEREYKGWIQLMR